MLIIELVTDETLRNKFSGWQKFVIFITFLIIFGLIFTSLYVQWTTIGSESILGVQGRYFIPILPLLMLLIGNDIKIKSGYNDKSVLKAFAITGLLINIIVILTIIINHL